MSNRKGAFVAVPNTQTAFVAGTPDFTLPTGAPAKRWLLCLANGEAARVSISFDGANTHAVLQGPGVLELHERAEKLWLAVAGAAGTVQVGVTAEDSSW